MLEEVGGRGQGENNDNRLPRDTHPAYGTIINTLAGIIAETIHLRGVVEIRAAFVVCVVQFCILHAKLDVCVVHADVGVFANVGPGGIASKSLKPSGCIFTGAEVVAIK